MANEKTLLRNNIKTFRQLINEQVDRFRIEKAINDQEILKIYYAGDDTWRRGFRTIEPHVLGFIERKNGTGDLAVRAWQQAGASDTFKNPVGRWKKIPPRLGHEQFNDPNLQPGWRLFKIKDITYALPAGHFPAKGKGIRPMYKGDGDDGFAKGSIITFVKTEMPIGGQQVGGADSIERSDDFTQKLSAFDTQSDKWKIDASDEERNLIRNLIALVEKVKTLDKDAVGYYDLVRKDGQYDAVRRNSRKRYKYNDDEVVGNLLDLYNKYSESNFDDKDFFTKQLTRGKIADKKA